jgi:hypothetical protein
MAAWSWLMKGVLGDEREYAQHKLHLQHYWPVLCITIGLEIAAYLLVHPDLVTLLVCLKTVGGMWIWLGINEDGVFVGLVSPRL